MGRAVYVRISRDIIGERLGVERQIAACRKLAGSLDWDTDELAVYEDNDRSAWSRKPRPAYTQLLADIASGAVDGLVVYDLDRLHRHPKELEHFIDVVSSVGLYAIHTVAGDTDLSTPDGQFKARIMGAVAKKESDDKSRRIRARFEADRAAGLPANRGRRPYGYAGDRMTLVPDEAARLQQWANAVLSGVSLHQLARAANTQGVATIAGGTWRHTTIRAMLLNPRYAGLYGRGGHGGWEIIGPAAWPPLWDLDTHMRLTQTLSRPTVQSAPRTRWLTGILYCARCLVRMEANGNGKRVWYECRPKSGGCSRTIEAHQTETVMRDVLFVLDDDHRLLARSTPDTSLEDIDGLHAELEQLAAAYGRGHIGFQEWMAAKQPLDGRLAAARRAADSLRRARGPHPPAEPLADRWETLTVREKAAACRDHIGWITVDQGRSGPFDPTRLTPHPPDEPVPPRPGGEPRSGRTPRP